MSEVKKSEAIRAVLVKYPELKKAKDIVAKVKEEFKLDVTTSNVYPILNRTVPEPSLEQVFNFLPVVQEVGGFEEAQKALFFARKLLDNSDNDLDLAVKLCYLAEKLEKMTASKQQETVAA